MRILSTILSLSLFLPLGVRADAGGDLTSLQRAWARAWYQAPDERVERAFADLDAESGRLLALHPDDPRFRLWRAIVLSSRAGKVRGLSALGWVREARDLLETLSKAPPKDIEGSVYASLGRLYDKVPGWPLGFGDGDKAEAWLKKALAATPGSIDANYFYADHLFEAGDYARARAYARRALEAPARPGRRLADRGRRDEARRLLARIDAQLAGAARGGLQWN